MQARDEAATARRKGMRKSKALTSGKVRAMLGCSLTELNRWVGDGRFLADGEIFITGLPKNVTARGWLPTTVERQGPDWRMAKPRRDGKIFQAPRASFDWLTRISVMAFLKQFPGDDACWSHLERVRWPDGPVCPKCGNVGPTMKCGRVHYHLCKACNAKFTVAMRTPLEGHLPMRTWFTAL
jgi:Transposase zinc-ribbon domain